MEIDKIDSNLKIKTDIKKDGIRFYSCKEKFFELNGLMSCKAGESFSRLPAEIAKNTNPGVESINSHTAGGRLRFKVKTNYMAIIAQTVNMSKMPHMPFSGSIGFDAYEYSSGRQTYICSFIPPVDITDKFEAEYNFTDEREREIIINFPLYGGVRELYIGLPEDTEIKAPHEYKINKPVVYYGSSITQGGCASRPGNSYQAIISRKLDCDYINLGFSGSAKGENAIAEYISKLKMSAFVYDYDHNAPTREHLLNTHKPMFDIIRKANPYLPIVMLSRPDFFKSKERDARFEIIKRTYDIAKSGGDENVYLINGGDIMQGAAEDNGTVDGCHPNDLGFYSMAQKIGDLLEKILL